MEFSSEFFKEEIRADFLVTEKQKKYGRSNSTCLKSLIGYVKNIILHGL